MSTYNPDPLSLAVAQAASGIRSVLAKGGEAATGGSPERSAAVGEAIDRAAALAGGDPALFRLTALLAHEVPMGARSLRSAARAYRRDKLISEASLFIFDLLAGDPDYMPIGRKVDETIKACGGDEATTLELLANKLEVSSRSLAEYRDAFLIAKLGGKALADLIPCGCPPSLLAPLSRILESTPPWRQQDAVLKAAREAIRLGLRGKEVMGIVMGVIAEDAANQPAQPIVPRWNYPSVSAQAA